VLDDVTKGLVLHPVAAGLTFIALLIAMGASCIGFLCAAAIAALAWVITLVVLVIDLALFGAVRVRVSVKPRGHFIDILSLLYL
jgi:hypothetical protein